MGLFSKKSPCPICGGKISWFLPTKIEGEYICDTCYSKIDMESEKVNQMKMEELKDYLAFYDKNQLLENHFVISERVGFGIFDSKIIFDYQNKLFCMSKSPDKTVFEGRQLKSFTIREDRALLYEGSANGIVRYTSNVPGLAMSMAPQIAQSMLNKQMARTLDKLDDGIENGTEPMQYFDILAPFKSFYLELHFEHPYWTVMKCDMDGPQFNNSHPDVNDYLQDYKHSLDEIEKLVTALKTVAFPEAPTQFIGLRSYGTQTVTTSTTSSMDVIDEIKKYKNLMKVGIISKQKFDAKKKTNGNIIKLLIKGKIY